MMVSDILKDVLPLGENDTAEYQKEFFTVALVVDPQENSLMGTLVGIELQGNQTSNKPKLDLRVSFSDAFKFISDVLLESVRVESIILAVGESAKSIEGPYHISSAKIVETDSVNKSCILAIDLFNAAEETAE